MLSSGLVVAKVMAALMAWNSVRSICGGVVNALDPWVVFCGWAIYEESPSCSAVFLYTHISVDMEVWVFGGAQYSGSGFFSGFGWVVSFLGGVERWRVRMGISSHGGIVWYWTGWILEIPKVVWILATVEVQDFILKRSGFLLRWFWDIGGGYSGSFLYGSSHEVFSCGFFC